MKTQILSQKEKRRKLLLSLPKDWFNFSVDKEELKEAMKGYCCKNMAQCNKWTIKISHSGTWRGTEVWILKIVVVLHWKFF